MLLNGGNLTLCQCKVQFMPREDVMSLQNVSLRHRIANFPLAPVEQRSTYRSTEKYDQNVRIVRSLTARDANTWVKSAGFLNAAT